MKRAFIASVLLVAACGPEPLFTPPEEPRPEPLPAVEEPEPDELFEAPEAPPVMTPAVGNVEPFRDGPPYPIVLVHGFSGFTSLGPLEYFFEVKERLEDEGHVVYTPALPPYNDSADRARTLANVIDAVIDETNKAKVHLIGHSQGGVDSRRAIVGLGYEDRVASLITVASPHRGTSLADDAVSAPEGLLNPAGRMLAWMIGAVDDPPNQVEFDDGDAEAEGWDADLDDAIDQLSTEGMAHFNAAHPNPEGLPIFSVAGYSNLQGAPGFCDNALWDWHGNVDAQDTLLLGPAAMIAGFDLVHNDGIVPTHSAQWGTLLACIPADHFDQVGQIGDLLPNLISGFDHRELYSDLAAFARTLE
jgi:triacylglycerol lipase